MMRKISRALISVSDKAGIVEFAKGLSELGTEIISTGGTAKLLREAGLTVADVADVTGYPEMLDGRVKTLHPKIHGGILAVRANPDHRQELVKHGIDVIDLVAINLYPFESTAAKPGVHFEELIENIDIGGPSMIRSAAKNFEDVTVVIDPQDYASVLGELRQNGGSISRKTRARLSRKAFATTAAYDAEISSTLQSWAARDPQTASGQILPGARAIDSGSAESVTGAGLPEYLHFNMHKKADLRYGENPHQRAALYLDPAAAGRGLAAARQLQGKELSFNNLVDLDAALRLVGEFTHPATAIIKHTNPCGIASQSTLVESFQRAWSVDPVSAFGSAIAFNKRVDVETGEALAKQFVEAVVAPGFDPAAVERLSAKKNLRLIDTSTVPGDHYGLQFKTIGGGLLVQTPDVLAVEPQQWRCVTDRRPTQSETAAMVFAWRVVKHVKSNAIVFAHANVAVGVGAGQMSRVDAVKLAVIKARELKHSLASTAVASDAFFPFPDGVEEAAKAGATAIVQPGGSVRDAEVTAVANQLGLTMMFTGVRHFAH
jgi:phosphoribosylaminoimidazolecarboxamide formyltransferase/IMP cyclohydrolase